MYPRTSKSALLPCVGHNTGTLPAQAPQSSLAAWSIYLVEYKGRKVAISVFVVVECGVHGSDVGHISLVNTCMHEVLVPQ